MDANHHLEEEHGLWFNPRKSKNDSKKEGNKTVPKYNLSLAKVSHINKIFESPKM